MVLIVPARIEDKVPIAVGVVNEPVALLNWAIKAFPAEKVPVMV